MDMNAKFVKNIKSYGINADVIGTVIFIMMSLEKKRYDLLDALDDGNRERRIVMLYQMLQRLELLSPTDEDAEVHYEITDKGYDFLNYIHTELNSDEVLEEAEVDEALERVKDNTVADWILEYINLFPAGIVEGKRLRVGSAECIPKMNNFITKYGYDKDTILEATRLYLEDEHGGRMLTRNCKYFIEKHDKEKGYISDLLTYCERVVEGQTNPQEEKINLDVM